MNIWKSTGLPCGRIHKEKGSRKMIAIEMFEALGFKRMPNTKTTIRYYNEIDRAKIIFFSNSKTYSAKRESSSMVLVMNVEYHNAITQQMLELGWFSKLTEMEANSMLKIKED